MTETSAPPSVRVPARGSRWLLIGSLALNLVFIGGLFALWLKGPPGSRHFGASQSSFGLMMFSRDLPPERREVVRKHLRDARSELKTLRTELRAARKNAVDVLASPNYTPEQMRAALDAVAAADNKMREAGAAALMKAISELSPDERQKLADAWTRRLEREQRRRSGTDERAAPEYQPERP